jgi:hypothetical protein
MPFNDVVGKGANESPAQIGFMESNIGVTIGFTTIVSVWGVAHWLGSLGVNVYSVVIMLFSTGLHVPVIPFVDVVGKGANRSPAQIAFIGAKSGVTDPEDKISIYKFVGPAHWFGSDTGWNI